MFEAPRDDEGGTGTRAKGEEGSMGRAVGNRYGVRVEARFDVDEYEIVILSADVERVVLEGGRAVLSPLRFEYDEETFRLPVLQAGQLAHVPRSIPREGERTQGGGEDGEGGDGVEARRATAG